MFPFFFFSFFFLFVKQARRGATFNARARFNESNTEVTDSLIDVREPRFTSNATLRCVPTLTESLESTPRRFAQSGSL